MLYRENFNVSVIPELKFNSLDLSITNTCNAFCTYCPTPRLKSSKRFMEVSEVGVILKELQGPEFVEKYGRLHTIEIGGMAEPLIHPRFLEALRLVKTMYPVKNTVLYTNGVFLDADTASALLSERLITKLIISVDGLSEKEQMKSKGISYSIVSENILSFINLRDKLASPCRLVLNVLTYANYLHLVRAHLKRNPLSYPDERNHFRDNTAKILKKWRQVIGKSDIVRDASYFFQLRGEYSLESSHVNEENEQEYRCPWIYYVAHSINITSNGDWIACCNDFYKEMVLGNVFEKGLKKIAESSRKKFVSALLSNDIRKLPHRCRHRKYCQFLRRPRNG